MVAAARRLCGAAAGNLTTLWNAVATAIRTTIQKAWTIAVRCLLFVPRKLVAAVRYVIFLLGGDKRCISKGDYGVDIRPANLDTTRLPVYRMAQDQRFSIWLSNKSTSPCDAVVLVFGREIGVFRMNADSSCLVTQSAYNQTPFIFEGAPDARLKKKEDASSNHIRVIYVSRDRRADNHQIAARHAENVLRRLEAIERTAVPLPAADVALSDVPAEPVPEREIHRIDDEVEQVEPYNGTRTYIDTRIFPLRG